MTLVTQNDYNCIPLLSNMFELRVITSSACINWLPPNFGTRNDLISVFHQILTLAKGWAAPDYTIL